MILQCRLCGAQAESWDILAAHEREAHRKPPDGVTFNPVTDEWVPLVTCARCGEKMSEASVNGHMLLHAQQDRDRANAAVPLPMTITTNDTSPFDLSRWFPTNVPNDVLQPPESTSQERRQAKAKKPDVAPSTGEPKRRIKMPEANVGR